METLTIVLLIMSISVFLIGLPIGGFFLGMMAQKQPVMTFGVVDYSELRKTGKIVVRFIKYHPSSLNYANPLADTPEHHGLVTVVEKYGWYGWLTRPHHWEATRLVPPKDLKHGLGTYQADLLNGQLRQRIDHLSEENGNLELMNQELREQLAIKSRSIEEQADLKVDKRMKDVQKVLPPMANARKTGGAR